MKINQRINLLQNQETISLLGSKGNLKLITLTNQGEESLPHELTPPQRNQWLKQKSFHNTSLLTKLLDYTKESWGNSFISCVVSRFEYRWIGHTYILQSYSCFDNWKRMRSCCFNTLKKSWGVSEIMSKRWEWRAWWGCKWRRSSQFVYAFWKLRKLIRKHYCLTLIWIIWYWLKLNYNSWWFCWPPMKSGRSTNYRGRS